jgi:hypothetical protein
MQLWEKAVYRMVHVEVHTPQHSSMAEAKRDTRLSGVPEAYEYL